MGDVCLVSMPTLGHAKSTIVPHWILWLAGYLEQKKYRVDVVDVKSDVNGDFSEREKDRVFQETVEKVTDSHSPLVGVSGFTEEYQLYEDGKTYTSIVDPRFHLAAHSLNIEGLCKKLGRRFMLNHNWQIISLDPLYLRTLWASKRRSQYLFLFTFRLFRKLSNLFWKHLPRLRPSKEALLNNN